MNVFKSPQVYVAYIHSVYICNIKRHTKNNNAIEAPDQLTQNGKQFCGSFSRHNDDEDSPLSALPTSHQGSIHLRRGILEII